MVRLRLRCRLPTLFFSVKLIGKTTILPGLTYDGGPVNVIKTSNCSGPGLKSLKVQVAPTLLMVFLHEKKALNDKRELATRRCQWVVAAPQWGEKDYD